MIVTSKRCFINCFAQFMDHRQLVETNYYILDVSNGVSNSITFNKTVEYDDEGNQIIREVPAPTAPTIERFHIHYSNGALDPSNCVLNSVVGVDASKITERDALKIYKDNLTQPGTIGDAYDWFYGRNKPVGNGLMVVIINKEDNVRVFGHTICEFLAYFLGEDVEFIDAQIRPEWIPGYPRYKGNKAFAEQLLRDQRDYALYQNFIGMVSTMGDQETRYNLTTLLDTLNPNGLMHLYELLYPNEPLPPGNYTTAQVKEILIGKTLERLPPQQRMPNLYTSNAYLDSIIDEIDRLGKQ